MLRALLFAAVAGLALGRPQVSDTEMPLESPVEEGGDQGMRPTGQTIDTSEELGQGDSASQEADWGRSLVCYYTPPESRLTIPADARLFPAAIPPLCTHVVYGFAGISARHQVVSPSEGDGATLTEAGTMAELRALKAKRPGTKVLVALKPDPLVRHHSAPRADLARLRPRYAFLSNAWTRWTLAKSLRSFLLANGLDGAVLHLPGADRHKYQYLQLLKDIRALFHETAEGKDGAEAKELSLSVFVGAKHLERCKDFLPTLGRLVDSVFLGTWVNGKESNPLMTAYVNPLHSSAAVAATETLENAALFAVASGIPRPKLIVGLSLWPRTYRLRSAELTEVANPAKGWGAEGYLSKKPGHLVYPEVCELRSSELAQDHFDLHSRSTYVVNVAEEQWVAYNGPRTLKDKDEPSRKEKKKAERDERRMCRREDVEKMWRCPLRASSSNHEDVRGARSSSTRG